MNDAKAHKKDGDSNEILEYDKKRISSELILTIFLEGVLGLQLCMSFSLFVRHQEKQ